MLGVAATVFMPERAALPKVAATRGYGATVHLVGATIDESLAAAHEFAERTGAVLVHPFDHVDVIAGQGTVGLEILEQCPDVAHRARPARRRRAARRDRRGRARAGCGWSACRPPARRRGRASLAAQAPTALPTMRTLADGIAVGRPGDVTFPQVTALVDEIVTVDDDALSRALLYCLERAKLLVEPAGAAAVAALLEHPRRFPTPVVAVLSGGNVDPRGAGPRDPARHGRGRPLRRAADPDRGPARRARRPAEPDRGAGGERARRGALADLGRAAPRARWTSR